MRPSGWLLASSLGLAVLGPGLPGSVRLVNAQTQAPVPEAPALDTQAPVLETPVHDTQPPLLQVTPATYSVEIDAPLALVGTLREGLDILRWRAFEGMTRDLLDRLVVEANLQLADTLATEGYFSPKIAHTITGDARPWTVRFEIDPGEPTLVTEVRIAVVGTIANDPDRTRQRRERIEQRWPLPAGARFRQRDWDRGKRIAIEELAGDRFAGASLRSSKATIDPAAREAVLEIEVDSGPAFRFGALEVRGLSRYPESVVRNLSTFRAGDPFDEDVLLQFQRRLTATGHFSAVQVEMDESPATAEAAPVRVSVIEGSTRRVEAGVGYSTDTLLRFQFGYTDNDFLDRGWRWRSDARFESRSDRLSSTIALPARADGWQHAYRVLFEQSDISGLKEREGSATFTRTAIDERHQPQWSLSAHLQQQQPFGSPTDTVTAVFGAFRYTRRATDDLLSPTRGTILSGQIGAAPPGLATRAFVRAVGQAASYVPLGRMATLVLRAEAGAVGSNTTDGIPESFLFRTGGDTSIRGYAFESIGVNQGSAIVGGRLYALGSVEAIRWINETWGVAAFYDVGNAADRVEDMRPLAQGAGFGARLRTPLGPVRVDLAYGERTNEVRLHLSMGVTF